MSVTVYSRLNELLRQRDMVASDLERHIDERFGVLVDPGALDRYNSARATRASIACSRRSAGRPR